MTKCFVLALVIFPVVKIVFGLQGFVAGEAVILTYLQRLAQTLVTVIACTYGPYLALFYQIGKCLKRFFKGVS